MDLKEAKKILWEVLQQPTTILIALTNITNISGGRRNPSSAMREYLNCHVRDNFLTPYRFSQIALPDNPQYEHVELEAHFESIAPSSLVVVHNLFKVKCHRQFDL